MIRPVDEDARRAASELHARLTKPAGSLGRVEDVGAQLAAVARTCPPPVPEPAAVAVFAADHGVHARGVSPWPQAITAAMVANLAAGGAAVNVLARHARARVVVVDVGVATPLAPDGGVLHRRVRPGTADLAVGPAMSPEEVRAASEVGAEVAAALVDDGCRCLLTGDMGIANTTAAAAVVAALTGRPGASVTGRGTGIDDEALARKVDAVEAGLARVPDGAGADTVLAEVGGLEIAALAGFVEGGARLGVPVIADGLIALAGVLAAVRRDPAVAGYVVAGHRSVEPGATAALDHLGLVPVLDLDLRLGEGTGAVLALPIVQAASKILREMATFDELGRPNG